MKTYQDEKPYIIPYYLPLKDYFKEGEKIVVELGAGEKFKRLRLDRCSLDILKKFLQPHSISDILARTSLPTDKVKAFCHHLINEGIIIEYMEIPSDYRRYDRHLQYYSLHGLCPIKAQNTLKNITITLVGMGGIGNWIALNLIGLGIKKMKLIDADIIEESNLTRQVLFSEDDIGKLKVEVAAHQLKQRNRNVQIDYINSNVDKENILKLIEDTSFVVLSADRPFFAIQKWLNEACIHLKVPLLNVGYAAGDGLMGPLIFPGSSSCFACNGYINDNNYYLKDKDSDAEKFASHFKSPSFSCLNSLISCMASYEIVKFLLGFGECMTINHALRINPLDFTIKRIYCEGNKTCSVCQISQQQ